MAKEFFSDFPIIKYNNEPVRDISVRLDILENVKADPYAFLPYTIKDGERAEEVAYLYYGDPRYVWVVYLSNDIIDPYFEWPLSNYEFEQTLAKTYAKRALAASPSNVGWQQVVNWSQSTSTTSNIVYYRRISDPTVRMNKDGLAFVSDAADWQAVRVYDEEFEANESRRNIQLLNKEYVSIVERNLTSLLNE
jgi:hypothetical protein